MKLTARQIERAESQTTTREKRNTPKKSEMSRELSQYNKYNKHNKRKNFTRETLRRSEY